MKGIRFLLLLLVSIVGQGAWAQDVLHSGENTIDIAANSYTPNSYGWFNEDEAFQYFTFVAPCDCNIVVTDITGNDDRLCMYLKETGNCSSDDIPTYMNVYDLEKDQTYHIGLREYNGNALQNVKIRIDIECLNHNFNSDGVCLNEGCTKKLRKLEESLNEQVDCSYSSDPYLFIPTKSGKLNVIARDANGDEAYRFYYTLKDENDEVLYTNYVASAPKRKVARGYGFTVEAGKKYFLDFSQNHSGTYDILLEVEEELPPVELNDTQSNEVSFPVGYEQLSGFKYTVKEKGGLTVSIDTDAEVVYADIIPWEEWLQWQDEMNGDSPASAPRKAAGLGGNEPLVLAKVVEPGEYAIFIVTTTNEETSADISLSLTTEVATTLSLGNNWVAINGDGNEDWDEESKDAYTLFPYTPAANGILTVESKSDEYIDLYGALFDADYNFLKSDDDSGSNGNFKISAVVEGSKTYYVGIRHYSGDPIDLYLLNVNLKDLPIINNPLELSSEDGDEVALCDALDNFLGEYADGDLFKANGVTYKRAQTTNKWGTVVLPYQLESNEKVAYYELTTVDLPNGILEFTRVDFVKPNTPTVYRIIEGNQYDASVSGEVLIEIPQEWGYIWGPTKANDWSMEGWYYDTTINTQNYRSEVMYISDDKFWHATGTLHMKPYRAYFYTFNWPADAAKAMTILFKDDDSVTTIESVMGENGEFTDIEAIYDLYGRKIETMKHGVNIIRTSNGKIRKFIKK